jgi:hypothetical protein
MAEMFDEFKDLSGVGFQGGGGSTDPTPPEDEFFHSLYIAGKTRKNHINIDEKAGKLQIRGVQYNLDEVHMIITHVKDILAKIKVEKGKGDTIECFSFKEGAAPWYGTTLMPDGSKRVCPTTSPERAVNSFCNTCKSQIIVGGIFCNEDGSPILTDEKKPIFIFIRAKGMRYSNVSEYLNDRYNEDLDPIFTPVTEQTKMFEKQVVNNKRFVVKLTKGEATSSYGNDVNVFVLEKGIELNKDVVLKIMKLAKDTMPKFIEKFDWSKSKKTNATGYGGKPEGILEIGTPAEQVIESTKSNTEPEPEKPKSESAKKFSFDDIEF